MHFYLDPLLHALVFTFGVWLIFNILVMILDWRYGDDE